VLLLRIQTGDEPSSGVRRLSAAARRHVVAATEPNLPPWLIPIAVIVVAIILGVLFR
jgi:hypothetical protein